jgi:hypothetical protein
VTGGSEVGSTLTCSTGAWGPDLVEAFLYQAPTAFAFAWSRNGTDIPGATAATYKATQGGDYRCRVTASNHAGATAQTSAASKVSGGSFAGAGFGKKTRVSLKLLGAVAGSGPLRVRISNANAFTVTGKVGAATTKAVTVSKKRRLKLKSKSFSVEAGKKKTVKLKLSKALRGVLRKKGKVALRLTATVRDPAGTKRTVKKKVSMKLKRRKSKR